MKRAAVYLRVSTHMQERDGVSMDAQLDMARRACELRGLVLVEVYRDTMSGTDASRPDLARLEADMEAGRFDAVLVYKIDRLSRDPAHYLALLNRMKLRGVGLASLTEPIDATSSMGEFVMHVLIGMAKLEVDRTSERVRDSCAYRATQGRLLMGKDIPLGYTYHKAYTTADGARMPGRLEVDPAGAIVVRWLYDRFLAVRSIRQLVTEAPGHGFTFADGRPMNHQGVSRVLRSPLYKGQYAALKTRTIRAGTDKRVIKLPRSEWRYGPSNQPAIVDEATWDAVQAILDDNARKPPRLVDSQTRYPWSGLLRCACCGGSMSRGRRIVGRDRSSSQPMYACSRRMSYGVEGCATPGSVGEVWLMTHLAPAILDRVSAALAKRIASEPPKHAKRQPRDRAKDLDRIDARRAKVRRAYFDTDTLNDAQYDAEMGRLAAEEAAIKEAMREQAPAEEAPRFAEDVRDLWVVLENNPGGRNALLRELIASVSVDRSIVARGTCGVARVEFHEYSAPAWPADFEIPIANLSYGRAARGR